MEELEKLQQRERELVRQLFGKDKTSTKRKRDSSASSEEGSKAVKIKNLIQFTNSHDLSAQTRMVARFATCF
jgi:hypothetical protein